METIKSTEKNSDKLEKMSEKLNENEARTKIIEVATKLFAEKGLDGTSTRDIAKESGLNLSLISYYFGGKEGLYRTVLLEFVKSAQQGLMETMAPFDPKTMTTEQFQHEMSLIITRIMNMKMKNPQIMALMQREVLAGLPYARDIYENVLCAMGEAVVSVLKEAQKKKIIQPDLNLHFHFLSMVHSIDMFFVAQKCKGPWEKKLFSLPGELPNAIDQIIKVFIEGILL